MQIQQIRSSQLTICSFNCKGFTRNYEYVKNIVINSDITFLQEVWLHPWDDDLFTELKELGYENKLYPAMEKFKSNRTRAYQGLLWFYKTELQLIIETKITTKRISQMTLKNGDRIICLTGVYLSCMGFRDSLLNFKTDLVELEQIINNTKTF